MRVGVVGLGRMGTAIATRYIQSGYDVAIWNRTAAKTEPLMAMGAVAVTTPADIVDEADTIITMLSDAAAIDSAFRAESGILEANLTDKLVIEMSTVQPKVEMSIAKEVLSKGGGFVECPVGGTVQTTLAGNLFGFAGGSPDDVARARPLLDQLCRRVEHVGPVGAGASMKLAINLPLATYWQSLGEAFAICRHLGLDVDLLVELFAESSAGPNVLRIFSADIANAFKGLATSAPPFDCDLLRKDLRTMIEDAGERNIDLPLSQRTLEIYDEASSAGWGARAGFDLAAYWAQCGNDLAGSKEGE